MDVIGSRNVSTRKEHICWGCSRKFPAGMKMRVVTCADAGRISTAYWCKSCCDFMDTLPSYETEDGFGPGDLLNYDEYRMKIKGNDSASPV